MYFEGSEKKLEVSLKPGAKSLKSLPRTFWENIVRISGARILSTISSPLCDSYLLSESSLFVFPHKFLLITCGRTRLVPTVREFLSHVKIDEIDSLFYERKNELFPAAQTSHFYQDAEELARMLPGQAYRFGDEAGEHLFVFHLDKTSSYLKSTESTLEILMHELSTEAKSHFTQGKAHARRWIADNDGFKSFFSSYDIHDHGFEPYGYSLNAIKGDRYFTFHVSPEARGSYASFETNCVEQGAEELVQAVRSLFFPKSYQVVYFGSGDMLPFPNFATLPEKSRVEKEFSNGHMIQYFNICERKSGDVLVKLEMPKYVEPKVQAKPIFESDWVFEKTEHLALGSKIKAKLFQGQSQFQKVEVIETESWGKTLLNDGLIMCTEKDEHVYHEMIVHPALFVHPDPARILIVGGGDLGTAREVLKHKSVLECVCVEIDQMVVDACKEHFIWPLEVLTDPRFELKVCDALKFVAETERLFDVVIVDSSDAVGPGVKLFGDDFYNQVKRVLAPGGVVVSQAESPFYFAEEQKALRNTLASIFTKVFLYNYSNMTYPGGLWSFAFSSENYHPLEDYDREKANKTTIDFKYYNPEVHFASFFLPTFMRKNLKEAPSQELESIEQQEKIVEEATELLPVSILSPETQP